MKRTLLLFLSAITITLMFSLVANAQWFRGDPKNTIRQLETETDQFRSSLDGDLDHSPLNGTRREDEINEYVKKFEEATDRLKDRSEDQGYAPNQAREVLVRGREIDTFMRRHRMRGPSEADWRRVRASLSRLAWSYRIAWRW
jgi:hypothetical protein